MRKDPAGLLETEQNRLDPDGDSAHHTQREYSLWDKYRKQIVYVIKKNQKVTKEIDIILDGYMMILEAPLVGKELSYEVEEGHTVIGFSEIILKPESY